jgi:hypothetical protein
VASLQKFLQTEEFELERVKADVEKRRAEHLQIGSEYKRLVQRRDEVKARLAAADTEFEGYKARRVELAENLRTIWWGNQHPRGSAPAADGYATVLALDAAIADYPNARKVITDELEQLEASVVAFEREHLE